MKSKVVKTSLYNKSEIMKHAWRLFRAAKSGAMKWAEALRRAWQYAKDAIEWDLDFDFDSMPIVGEKRYPKSHMNYARVGNTYCLKRNLLNV